MFQWYNALSNSISELKMMVKIGVIFMPFSNPTYHFRGTADFTDCTVGKVSCTSEMASRIWKWNIIIFSSKMLIWHCITSRWPEFNVWYVLKLWGRWANLKWLIFFQFFWFFIIIRKFCACHQFISLRGQEQIWTTLFTIHQYSTNVLTDS